MSAQPQERGPADVEEVLVSTVAHAKLHVPGDDGPVCGIAGEYRRKSLAVYPPSHRDWCRRCLDLSDAMETGS